MDSISIKTTFISIFFVLLVSAIVFSIRFFHNARGFFALASSCPAGSLDVTQPPFSADNTGASDVTGIIQDALNAANLGSDATKIVCLPSGTFKISIQSNSFPRRALTIYPNIKITGSGTLQLAANSGNYGTVLGAEGGVDLSGFQIENITIDQAGDTNPITSSFDIVPPTGSAAEPLSTLSTAMTESSLAQGETITVSNAQDLPTGDFDAEVYTSGAGNFEYMKLTRTLGSNSLTVQQRAAYGTAAFAHPIGDIVIPAPNAIVRAAILINKGANISVNKVHFTNIGDTGWTLSLPGDDNNGHALVTNTTIQDNIFDGVGYGTLQHDHSTIYWAGNTLTLTGNTLSARGIGIIGATTAIETHGSSQVVSGNTVNNFQDGMNLTGVNSFPSSNINVSNNTFSGVVFGIYIWSFSYGILQTGPGLQNVTIANNTITVNTNQWPAAFSGLGGGSFAAGIIGNDNNLPVSGLTIQNNSINFATFKLGSASQPSAGIRWKRTQILSSPDQNISIQGNTFTGVPADKSVIFAVPGTNATGTTITPTTTSFLNPAPSNQPVTFNAFMPAYCGSGYVSFFDGDYPGGLLLGKSQLDVNGVASFSSSKLKAGSHTITGVFNGTAVCNQGTVSKINQVIQNTPSSKTTYTYITSSSPISSAYGQPVTFTAKVTGSCNPSGYVSFFDGIVDAAHFLGVGQLVKGQTSVTNTNSGSTYPFLTPELHNIIAGFNGSNACNPSQSSSFPQIITN